MHDSNLASLALCSFSTFGFIALHFSFFDLRSFASLALHFSSFASLALRSSFALSSKIKQTTNSEQKIKQFLQPLTSACGTVIIHHMLIVSSQLDL